MLAVKRHRHCARRRSRLCVLPSVCFIRFCMYIPIVHSNSVLAHSQLKVRTACLTLASSTLDSNVAPVAASISGMDAALKNTCAVSLPRCTKLVPRPPSSIFGCCGHVEDIRVGGASQTVRVGSAALAGKEAGSRENINVSGFGSGDAE